MRARLGIDKSKSWADWVDEEEEAATLSKTLEAATATEQFKPPPLLSLSMRLRGGGPDGDASAHGQDLLLSMRRAVARPFGDRARFSLEMSEIPSPNAGLQHGGSLPTMRLFRGKSWRFNLPTTGLQHGGSLPTVRL